MGRVHISGFPRHFDRTLYLPSSVIHITCVRSTAHCAASTVSANLISFNRVSEPHCVFLHPIDADHQVL